MIIVTGAAGFIGSCLLRKLNDEGLTDIIAVDEFSHPAKNKNLEGKACHSRIHRDEFLSWFEKNAREVEFIFHLGARTDTTEQDTGIFDDLNLHYSQQVWKICTRHNIPLVYASSAATYGMGEHGYDDRHDIVPQLKPLNPYGISKNDFDHWALIQTGEHRSLQSAVYSFGVFSLPLRGLQFTPSGSSVHSLPLRGLQFTPSGSSVHSLPLRGPQAPPFWAGLKFFNVYGPNEFHKSRMASVIFHTVRQIRKTGGMKLFRSHRPDVSHGHQQRDFVYVKDVVEVCLFFYKNRKMRGLYNVGTGIARTFFDLAANTFQAMGLEPNISFIDTPEDIRATYQYFTQANMEKLKAAGYEKPFYSLEEGVNEYVKEYLMEEKIW